MKKLKIRIFNLLFIAGGVFAILGFLIQPLVSLNVSLSVPVSEVVSLLNKDATAEDNSSSLQIMTRDEKKDDKFDYKKFITVENFEKEGITSLDLSFPITIEPKNITSYFDLKNNHEIIHDGVFNSIDKVLDGTFGYAKNIIKVLSKLIATDTVTDKVIEQFTDKLEETDEGAKALFEKYHCEDKVSEIVEDVLVKFEEGNTPVGELVETIIGEKDDNGEYTSGVKGILESIKDEPEFEGKITTEMLDDLNPEAIEEAINKAIEGMPEIAITQPKLDEEGNPILDNDGNPVTEYVIKDLNSAIFALLDKLSPQDQNSNGQGSDQGQSAEQIEEEFVEIPLKGKLKDINELSTGTSDAELREKLKSFLLTKLPFDLENVDYSFNGIMNYVLLGVIVLGILPWFIFILMTLIRTLRKKKCWTRPRFIFVFAFLELILGIGLTVIFKFAPKIASSILPKSVSSYTWLLDGLDITLKTAAYWASLVYLVMIPLAIVYVIICHKTKVEYKKEKIEAKAAKKALKNQEAA